MRCSECGGRVRTLQHLGYITDDGISGTHHCTKCGLSKDWKIEDVQVEETIDMSEEDPDDHKAPQ